MRIAYGRTAHSGHEEVQSDLDGDLSRLRDVVRPYSIELDRAVQEKLLFFARELIVWNDRLNLLSRADVYNVMRKHVAASLGVLLVATPVAGEKWIDVGTGGGFPGLVLRLVCPDLEITLLDSARKRCVFLENVLRGLDCRGVPVLAMRAETHLAHGDGRARYAVVTARAVASLRDAVDRFGPLIRPGGRLVTFKGPMWASELAEAQAIGALQRSQLEFVSATKIPWVNGRLLVFKNVDAGNPGLLPIE
jgi:16S rRNA (guanine527-N7)-methyltransferase